jgi:hypothetical protein
MEKTPENNQIAEMLGIADALDTMQASKNEGRGVACVRAVVLWLRKSDLSNARLAAEHDRDKIRSYPDILRFIQEKLFLGDDRWR